MYGKEVKNAKNSLFLSFNEKKYRKNLVGSEKSSTFAPAIKIL